MVALLRALAPDEGYNQTALPSVRILRSDRALLRTPVLYDPGIVIVCQARLLMVRQDLTAEAASHAVGYTSPSQFSREFKRLFGLTPAAETRRMRESFAVPAFADTTYVSSH